MRGPQDSELQELEAQGEQKLDSRLLALFEWQNDPRVLEMDELVERLEPKQVWFAAPAQLFRDGERWVWQVLICPGCGGQHEHDGGGMDSDPRDALTKVEMACNVERIGYAARSWGYVLAMEDHKGVASMIREAEKERVAEEKA
jgi:hypothetical protein